MKDLLGEGPEFGFFQAVRLLERMGGGPRLGREGPAAEERVRLRPSISLAFAPADVESIERVPPPPEHAEIPERLRLTTRFLGLYGASSPLPVHYAEIVAQGDPGEERVRDFLDLFHHRLLSLLYRAWARHHFVVEFAADGTDDLSRRLLAWLGVPAAAAERLGLAPVRLLRWAGLLLGRDKPQRALEIFWSEVIGAPIEIVPNVGRWVPIPPDQRSRLGRSGSRLGQDFVLGRRAYDMSGKFRIALGPIAYDTFVSFLPGAEGLDRLREAVAVSLPTAFDYEVELRLAAGSRPPFRLDPARPCRLGWTTWAASSEGQSTGSARVVFQGAAGA